ncbi:transposase [Streptomyces sp. A0592]|uniref:transposase n=1 Tax=Streptomyces sp. A0592 TaxID=2563099 RepID=UPI001446B79B|nr:transposase [Streptomyces sp. A0592]
MWSTARGEGDQLGAPALVLIAEVLWSTCYLHAAVEQLRVLPAGRREHDGLDEDVPRLGPLGHADADLVVLGR